MRIHYRDIIYRKAKLRRSCPAYQSWIRISSHDVIGYILSSHHKHISKFFKALTTIQSLSSLQERVVLPGMNDDCMVRLFEI